MEYRTKSEKFVLENKNKWEKLRSIVAKIGKSGFSSLLDSQVSEFANLYRMTISDLAEAKMLKLSPDVINYMNNIIGQSHKFLYGVPPMQMGNIRYFFNVTLPRVLLKNWHFVLLSAVLFFSSLSTTYMYVAKNPETANLIVPASVLSQMEESYRERIDKDRPIAMSSFASSFYIQNNVSIAFMCFAAGVLLGIGSIIILLYNGILLGAISGYISGIGYESNFINFVTAHSALELIGIVVSGGAGLALGFSIIKATRYFRKDYIKIQRTNILNLVAAAAIMITIAAFIEGFISPSALSYSIKLAIFLISLGSIIFYFFIYPFMSSGNLKREK